MTIDSLIKSNFFSIFVSLVIPSLITGPFLPNLILSLSSIFFLFFVIKKKLWILFYNNFYFLFFIFCIICIISSLFSENVFFSLKSSLFYFRIGIFATLIAYLISNNKNFIKFFYLSILISFSILIIDGYYQYFNIYNLFGKMVDGWEGARLSSLFGDELILGSYLSRLLPIFLALYFIKNNDIKKNNLSFIFIIILVCILIFLSGERASFVYCFLTLFILSAFNFFNRKFFFLGLLFAIIGILLFSYSNEKLRYRMFKSVLENDLKIITKNNNFNLPKNVTIFSDGHDALIRTAYNMFKHNPLLGVGPNLFRKRCDNEKYTHDRTKHFCDTHPHNFYIQIAAETGIFGMAMLLFFFVNVCLKLLNFFINFHLKKRVGNEYDICALISLFIVLFPFITTGNFFNSWIATIYSISLGFYIHSSYKKEN